MGGVLGGEKYVRANILFKFAVDEEGLFGGDHEPAAKVAGHELKGLKALFSTNTPGLCFPLMALIDYKGFRLVASSLLPLSKGSLILGSNDAGRTVHADDPILNEKVAVASRVLNLKPHACGLDVDEPVIMPCAVDLEGHQGVDGRYYILDFSRCFPPVTPKPGVIAGPLYQMFRAEFTKNFKLYPLCSDAYSYFVENHPDAKEHKLEVNFALKDLLGVTISMFSRDLVGLMEKEVRMKGTLAHFRLTETMHAAGINMRYLGIIIRRLGSHRFTWVLLLEMLARIVKQEIRRLLRSKMVELKQPNDEPLRQAVTVYLNEVFGRDSAAFWQKELAPRLDKKFDLNPDNWAPFPKNLRSAVFKELDLGNGRKLDGRWALVKRVRDMTGLVFKPSLVDILSTKETLSSGDGYSIWDQERIFDETDIVSMGEVVKHLDVVSTAMGTVYLELGEFKESRGFLAAARHAYQSALDSFQSALTSYPTDSKLLANCAKGPAEDRVPETWPSKRAGEAWRTSIPRAQRPTLSAQTSTSSAPSRPIPTTACSAATTQSSWSASGTTTGQRITFS